MKKIVVCLLLALFIVMPLANVLAQGTKYRYTGQEIDPSSNLYYYGQRYYDPNTSRFTQTDPLLKDGSIDPKFLNNATPEQLQKVLENPQNLNPYSYVKGNPIRYTDPTGKQAEELVQVGETVVVAGVAIVSTALIPVVKTFTAKVIEKATRSVDLDFTGQFPYVSQAIQIGNNDVFTRPALKFK